MRGRRYRERNGETQITDGPFAETKEYLGGYFLIECSDLDTPLGCAARVPNVHYPPGCRVRAADRSHPGRVS
jgi:hypothetical protein